MNIRYRVTLTPEERSHLETLIQGGNVSVRKVKRAQVLLAADRGSTDEAIVTNVAVGSSTYTGQSSASSKRASIGR